jgi:hypothetical protein
VPVDPKLGEPRAVAVDYVLVLDVGTVASVTPFVGGNATAQHALHRTLHGTECSSIECRKRVAPEPPLENVAKEAARLGVRRLVQPGRLLVVGHKLAAHDLVLATPRSAISRLSLAPRTCFFVAQRTTLPLIRRNSAPTHPTSAHIVRVARVTRLLLARSLGLLAFCAH